MGIEQTQLNNQPTAGVPEGEVLEGNDGTERVVYDYDDSGNVVGWHKETVGE
jgi:YD repeat-containing protein